MKLKHLIKTGSRLLRSLFTSSRETRVQSREPGKFVLVAALALVLMYGAYAQLVPGQSGSGLGLGGGTNGALIAQSLPVVPTPVISIAATNTNQVVITITNGVNWANYELYWRPVVDLDHPWSLCITGMQGQLTFLTDTTNMPLRFYEVCVGSDWDQDGIPNSKDGDPLDAGTGILSVDIYGPTNNAVVQ